MMGFCKTFSKVDIKCKVLIKYQIYISDGKKKIN